jgi:hypothetical protein
MGSVLAEFTLSTPVLEPTFEACPDAHVDYVQESVPTDRPARMAFWLVGDGDRFEAAMDEDPTVGDYDALATAVDRTLYRVEFSEASRPNLTYESFVDADGVVLSSVGDADGWHIRARFPDREALNAHRDRCLASGVGFTLDSLYTTAGPNDDTASLTSGQREALGVALEMGYFEVPREATAADVGERLGVTRQAVSERLRRAMATAAERTLREGN